jgi:hypothetical protein
VTRLRRTFFVLHLAGRRLARRPAGALLVALGIAAGAAALSTVLVGSLVARDRAAERSVRALDGPNRAFRVTWLGVPGQAETSFGALDQRARRALSAITPDRPFAVLIYRETRFGDALVDLGAIDGLGRWVRVTSGRLPHQCTASRCEVLQLGGQGRPPEVPGVPVKVVGTGVLTSETPFGSFILAGSYSPARAAAIGYHAPSPPLYVADGVEALAGLPALESIYRSYAWVSPVRPGSIHPWQLSALARRVARTGAALQASSPLYGLQTPVDELQTAASQSRAGARRLLLIGGEAAALLLAFALLSGSSLRRDLEAARRRLAWAGATRAQLVGATVAEAAVVAVVATVLGFGLGAGAGALLAGHAGTPVGAALHHSLFTGGGLALLLGTALATAILTVLALLVRGARLAGFTVGPLEIGALGALAAVAFGFARGRAGPEELATGGGTGALLALLPGLAAFVAAVVCARALPPLLQLAGRAARRGSAPARLAVLSLARHPGRSALAVAFLVVSIGLALFASTYRATLSGNEADEAAYSVPQDFVVEEDFSKLSYPLEVASLTKFASLAPGVTASPVLRLPADVEGSGSGIAPTVLGIPATELPHLRGWRSDFSSQPASVLAARIKPPNTFALRGDQLPAGARDLTVDAGVKGNAIALFADIETEDGGFVEVKLGEARPKRMSTLTAEIPEDAREGLLVGLRLQVTGPRNADAFDNVGSGTLTLGPLRAGGQTLSYAGWIGVSGVRRPVASSGVVRMRYVVSNEVYSRFRPRQPTDGKAVPAIVSRALAETAGPDGSLPIDFAGQQLLVRVVGTANRVPTVDGDFVLIDASWLRTALNADTPGSGPVQEIWLRVPHGERARVAAELSLSPFNALAHRSRTAVEASLRHAPLARGSLLTLAGAALAALLLAVGGLLLALVNDVRDERGELLDLEVQGASPAALRRHLRLRAALIAVAGLIGGVALGAVLSVLVVDLVALTAGAGVPQPPLRLYVDWRVLGVGAAAYALVTTLVIGLVTWLPFREQRAVVTAEPEAA